MSPLEESGLLTCSFAYSLQGVDKLLDSCTTSNFCGFAIFVDMDIAHVAKVDLQCLLGQTHCLGGAVAAGSSEKGGIVLVGEANLKKDTGLLDTQYNIA